MLQFCMCRNLQVSTVLKQETKETENVLGSCLYISCSVSSQRRFETVGGLEMEGQWVILFFWKLILLFALKLCWVFKNMVLFWYFLLVWAVHSPFLCILSFAESKLIICCVMLCNAVFYLKKRMNI